jgi:SNF2 family DNA or RNA helicase
MSTLDPVQIAALDFARDKRGVGWFIEQGMGKTLCALAEFSWCHKLEDANRMIVVTPNSFKQGWVDEIEKHGFDFCWHVYRSSQKAAADIFFNNEPAKPPVLIINYEALRLPAVFATVAKWAAAGKTYLAIDESINIKGHSAAQTRAAHRLALLCCFVRLLTGRPQTQGPHDLWGQLRAIGLYADRNYFSFRGAFCVMGGWKDKQVVAAKNVGILADAMRPAVFQAKKADWLPELPRKDYTIRDYYMSTEQLKQYQQMEHQFLLEIERGEYVTVDVAIAKYAKLAQIQCGFIYDDDHYIHTLVRPENNPRLNLLLQLLEEEVAGKACIVYRHRAVIDILTRALNAYDPAWIMGRMNPEDVSEQKERFNKDPHCRVILLQAEAAKFGHTLLGGPGLEDLCRTMIFFENSYSMDTRSQLEDRIHRRGQTGESVLYIDLSGSALDRRIVKALQHKDALYRSVFTNLKPVKPMEAHYAS